MRSGSGSLAFDNMLRPASMSSTVSFLLLGALSGRGLAQTLKTSSFSDCLDGASITVNHLSMEYDNDAKSITFNVAGTSLKTMNV